LTFLANPRYEPYLECTHASAIIVAENHRNVGKPLIQNANPYLAFLKAVRFFQGDEERPAPGVHPTAVVAKDAAVDRSASVGPRAVVHAGCYVGAGARLGPDAFLYPNVTVRERCEIGARVIIHSGTVIG